MTDQEEQFIATAAAEAAKIDHPFPFMAAAEAALESNYGQSELAREDFNLFGMKQHQHPLYGTCTLPTRECEGDIWETVEAPFVKYPDFASCFADRLSTLKRLASVIPNYARALAATDAYAYVTAVSLSWSTDPNRAAKVIAIYQQYQAPTAAPNSPTESTQ